MLTYPLIVADLVAILLLVFGLFLGRSGRRELIVAFLTVNLGVLAVTIALANSTIGAGLGLGLFGVLSIIRLRSEELAQREVAYYFAALALGLIGGIAITPTWLGIALMAAIVAGIAIADHPRLAPRTEIHELLLDRAVVDSRSIAGEVERRLGGEVLEVRLLRTDLVDDTTLVRVRVAGGGRASVPVAAPTPVRHEEVA